MRDRLALWTLALVVVAGCAVREAPLPPTHPANPRAPIGRIAACRPAGDERLQLARDGITP
jgi:hypothetical protein